MAKRLKYKYHHTGTVPALPSDCVLVFGSNERGLHRTGTAEVAAYHYGAQSDVFAGITGRSYAIISVSTFLHLIS